MLFLVKIFPSSFSHAKKLVLDLGLHGFDRVSRVHIESDGLARKGLDENLHRHPWSEMLCENYMSHSTLRTIHLTHMDRHHTI